MVGHLLASKLLITCRVIKVIPLYICFHVSSLSEIFHLQLRSIHVKFYVRHVKFCYAVLHCLCSELVDVIVIVQAQHINKRKYTNSYAIINERRQTIVCIDRK
jgi:hypothetical protein